MISLAGLVNQKAFGKFEMGKVVSNPFATAFIKEAEGEDHEVSMGQNQLDTIIKMATELKAKMGENEKEIPAWIQDHISKAENYISQAAGNYHEYGTNESINEIEYKDALEKFNLDLYKNSQVAAIAKHHNRPVKDVVKALQPYIKVLRYNDKSIKLISIDYRETNSNVKVHVSQTYKQNESVNEASPCWKGYKQVGMKDKNGKQVPNCVPTESVVNEAGVPKMYVKYMAVQKKVKELEDKQKAMGAKYFAEKDPKKKQAMMPMLLKGTKELASYRRNLANIEDKYINSLYDEDPNASKAKTQANRDIGGYYGPYNSDFD